jgi:hypothetical protein
MPGFTPLTATDPRTVAGYRLQARLGGAGWGQVYLSFTPERRPIAIKVMRSEYAGDEEFRRRFRQEIQAGQRVRSRYTAPVLAADPDALLPWLATAYVAGPSLRSAVTDIGPLPVSTTFRLLAGVAEALTAIHASGLIHRNLTPSNVILASDGPRVIDFGIALAADGTALTHSGPRIGRTACMAPEQIEGRPLTPATDVFALGQLALYAVTGRTAFGEGDEGGVAGRIVDQHPDLTDCPPELRDLVDRCLAKDPAERPIPHDVIAISHARTTGATRAPAESWLPPAVATALADYDATVAPTPTAATDQTDRPTAAIPAPDPTGPTVAAPRQTPRRRRGRRAAGISVVAVVIAAGAVIWALTTRSHQTAGPGNTATGRTTSQAAAGADTTGRAGETGTAGRAGGAPFSGSASDRPTTSSPALFHRYVPEFHDVLFNMLSPDFNGNPCSAADGVTFSADGPKVATDVIPAKVGNPASGDMFYESSCNRTDEAWVVVPDQNSLARVDTPPATAQACVTRADEQPTSKRVLPQTIRPGMGFCLISPFTQQVVYLKAYQVTPDHSIAWTATAWKGTHSP